MRHFIIALIALTAPALSSAAPADLHACVDDADGTMRAVDDPALCGRGDEAMSWNAVGPEGPTGPEGPRGPTGPQGPQGLAGTGILVKSAVYTVIERNPAGAYKEAYCEDPEDVLLNCSCRPQVSNLTVWAPMAINHTSPEDADLCRCVALGSANAGGDLAHGRGADFEVHATCVRAAGPLCGGNPPSGYGDVCNGVCEPGRIQCDGSCDAPPPPEDEGDACTARCRCQTFTGSHYRNTEGEMHCGACYAIQSCSQVCSD